MIWNEDVPEQKYKKMMKSPNTYGYFTATINPVKRLSLAVTGNYTGSMLIGHNAGSGVDTPEAVNTPTFMVVNAKLSYEMPLASSFEMQISCGIQNMFNAYQNDFDKGWNRDSDYIYGPSQPRSLYAGIKFRY